MALRTATFLLLMVFAAKVNAFTIRVPSQQPTIQAGLTAAVSGDTVLVGPGIYSGNGSNNLTFNGRAIRLHSEAGAPSTVIDCGNTTVAIVLDDNEPPSAEITGFTIRHCVEGIATSEASPTISHCVFQDNAQIAGQGAAAWCGSGAPTFIECVFERNKAARGGAIYCYTFSAVTLSRCTFRSNYAPDANANGGGAAIFSEGARVTLTDCQFLQNSAIEGGGAIHCVGGTLEVSGCLFEGNATLTYGGGAIQFRDGSAGTLGSSQFRDNSAIGCIGGAIALFTGANIDASNCTLYHNSAWAGGGVGLYQGSSATLGNAIVASSLQGQAVFCGDVSSADLTCSDVFDNAGGDWTGCLLGQQGLNGNLHGDPLFCDGPGGDLGLAADSPCAPGNSPLGCGLIGALPVGCGTTAVAEAESPARITLIVSPNPVRDEARFAAPETEAGMVEVFNTQGRLVERVLLSHGQGTWRPNTSVSTGIYFARLGTDDDTSREKFLYIR